MSGRPLRSGTHHLGTKLARAANGQVTTRQSQSTGENHSVPMESMEHEADCHDENYGVQQLNSTVSSQLSTWYCMATLLQKLSGTEPTVKEADKRQAITGL